MANYKTVEQGDRVLVEKSESKTIKTVIDVEQKKLECEQIDNEIANLIAKKNEIIAELEAINASGVVTVDAIPAPVEIK
jgi:flagellar biosynthesis/type III secretory pathway chaperone